MKISTCDLCDEFESILQIAQPVFSNYGGRSAFGGQIATIQCPKDNSLVRDMVATDGRGKVMVVAYFGSRHSANASNAASGNSSPYMRRA